MDNGIFALACLHLKLTLSSNWVTFIVVLVIIGMRVAFATALIGIVGLFIIFAFDKGQGIERGFFTTMKIVGQIPHSKTASNVLGLIPTFILIGYLAYYAGLTKALFDAAKKWVIIACFDLQ